MIMKGFIIVTFCLLFWFVCYKKTGTDKKNMFGFCSYPVEVQERVRADSTLAKLTPAEINIPKVILSNIILFSVVFGVIGVAVNYTLGFGGFLDVFVYFLIFGEIVNLFDFVVIDLIWWRNTPRIRFSCVPEKQLYQNPKVHIDSFLRGIPTFVVPAIVVAGLLQLLP